MQMRGPTGKISLEWIRKWAEIESRKSVPTIKAVSGALWNFTAEVPKVLVLG